MMEDMLLESLLTDKSSFSEHGPCMYQWEIIIRNEFPL